MALSFKKWSFPCSVRIESSKENSVLTPNSRKCKGTISVLDQRPRDYAVENFRFEYANGQSAPRTFKVVTITKAFGMYLKSGKLTIRFGTVDLHISDASPEALQTFISLVKKKRWPEGNFNKPEGVFQRLRISKRENYKAIHDPKYKNATILQIANIQLASIGPNVLNRPNLMNLELSGNKLSRLPQYWNDMSNLRVLDLRNNDLRVLPEEMFVASMRRNLVHLDLASNKLIKLPNSLFHCRNLRTLIVTYNLITELPPSFGCNPNLLDLRCGHNPLCKFPAELTKKHMRTLECGSDDVIPKGFTPPLQTVGKSFNVVGPLFPTLANMAAEVVLRQKGPISYPLLPIDVMVDISKARRCFVCRRLHFLPFFHVDREEPTTRFRNLLHAESLAFFARPDVVTVTYDVCSARCFAIFNFP